MEITNDIFNIALEKNISTINKATKSFHKIMSKNERMACGYYALLYCLKSHKNELGGSFSKFLYRMTRIECYLFLKKNKKIGISLQESINIPTYKWSKEIETKENKQYILENLKKIPNLNRQIIEMYYIDGKTSKEIGAVLNMSTESARTLLKESVSVLYGVLNNVAN